MLRIAQIGLGPLGRRIVRDLYGRDLGHVVAAIDPDPKLVGKELSTLVPAAESGTPIRSHLMEVEDWSTIRCAIVTTRSDLELCMDTFREVLGRGCPVVSTCEELAWPWLRHPILAQELNELAIKNYTRILGTGVNPGFLMDALPVAVSTACGSVDAVRVTRVQNASLRRIPFQRKIGAGLDLEEFARGEREGSLRHVGLGESLHFVAHYLRLPIQRWEETLEPVLAETALETALGAIEPGMVRGLRQVARAWDGERCTVELVFHAALEEPVAYDRIEIEGEPRLDLRFAGGVHGDVSTSAIVLNSIPPLLHAEVGLHTMATLPLQGCLRRSD